MAHNSKSKTHPNELGDFVANIRTKRRLSRSRLVKRMYKHIAEGFVIDETVSEGIIRTIEEGTRVTISKQFLELLALALECTPHEYADMLLFADKNILISTSSDITPCMRIYNTAMLEIYDSFRALLEETTYKYDISTFDFEEICELLDSALIVAKSNRKNKKDSAHRTNSIS